MYNGDVSGVSGGNNTPWNKKLAEQLDEADGKKDGKISANIWNGFIKHTGSSGNKIKWSINVENAAKSFSYYDTTKDSGKVDWNCWEQMYVSFSGKSGKKEETVPVEPETENVETDEHTPVSGAAPAEVSGGNPPVKPQMTEFLNAMQNVKFMDSIPDTRTLKSGGFGLEELPVLNLPNGQTIAVGKKDSDGLNYVLDKNGGKTYRNANGESLRICDFDAQSVVPGGTAVQYSDGKNFLSEVFYDGNGKPVQGSLIVRQDNGTSVEYKYKYDAGGNKVLESVAQPEDITEHPAVENNTGSDIREKVEITSDYKDNGDGTKTKTILRKDGKPGFVQTVDSEGHVISESEFNLANSGKELEIRRNYFPDGSIEKIAFLGNDRFDDFYYQGDRERAGDLQFKYVKDSPMKIVNSKMPTEADLLKAGYKLDDSSSAANGGKIYYNEQTGESFILNESTRNCEYRKGNITQRQTYDNDGTLTRGVIEVKGEKGAFRIYTYTKGEDAKEPEVVSARVADAPDAPEAFAENALDGHWKNIDAFREEFNLPADLTRVLVGTDITEGQHEKVSSDGNYKVNVTVDSNGNLNVKYSQKQKDGSFKELGEYKLTRYDSPDTLRGYDFKFEAFNNLTGNKHTVPGGDWSGDYPF